MPDDPLIGKTLEKCRILSKLGAGGMGSVYLAEHGTLSRKVAIKILPPEMGRDAEFVGRFIREATTAGRMEHPNIVQVYDVGFAEGHHFIVMQHVDGESLSTVVEELGAMASGDAARMAVGLLRGLHHAHEAGIVHRDVKPDNVIIAKGNQPKILDFGLAIETETALKITRDGMVVGTPYYVSPEQARGLKAAPSSDIYAAGVTLYFLLTGKKPFVGATAMAVLNMHIHQKPVPPRHHRKSIPAQINDIVLKMLAKKPEDRYATAAAAADDIENFLAGRDIQARPPLLPYWVTPIRAAAAGGGLLVLVLTTALLVRGGRADTLPLLPPPAADAPPDRTLELQQMVQFQLDHKADHAAWSEVINRYEAFLKAGAEPELADRARKLRDEFILEIEAKAREEYARLPGTNDLVARREALDRFPRGLLEISTTGAKVTREKAALALALREKFERDRTLIDEHLSAGRLEEARGLLQETLRYAEGSGRADLQRRLTVVTDRIRAAAEPELLRLASEHASVRAKLEAALQRRQVAEGYAHVTAFLKAHDDAAGRRHLRLPDVAYGELLAVVPNSTLPDSRLGDARLALAGGWRDPKDALPFHILSDFQDALDLEWLLRRTGRGLRRLADARLDVRLTTFGAEGKVSTGGKSAYRFVPKSGAERPLEIAELHPADLGRLAALAEETTLEAAWSSNSALARALGAAFLHSRVPDRWTGAARWLARAGDLGARGPGYRLPGIIESGRKDARDRLAQARKDGAGKKFDSARAALVELAASWEHEADLKEKIGRALSELLVAEIRAASAAKNHARVKELARQVTHGREEIEPLYHQALLNTGRLSRAILDLKGDYWTWEARAQGAPAPATDARHEGLRVESGRALWISAYRFKDCTGVQVQARASGNGAAGFRMGDRVAVLVEGRAALLESPDLKAKRLKEAALEKPVAPGQWVDLVLVLEGGDAVLFVDRKPLLTWREERKPEDPVGFWSSAGANFREIYFRK